MQRRICTHVARRAQHLLAAEPVGAATDCAAGPGPGSLYQLQSQLSAWVPVRQSVLQQYRMHQTAEKHSHGEPHSHDSDQSCWSCDHLVRRGGFVCGACDKIQPVDDTLNFFELFGIPRMKFDINPQALERQYKLLQWRLHPDKVVSKPQAEREYAAEQATLINHAYGVLKSPLSRANYILAQKGISAGEGFEGTITDPELLMKVLEAREEVEQTEDEGRLRQLLAENRADQELIVKELSAAFKQDATDAAVEAVTKLTYLVRLEQEIFRKLPSS